MDMDVVGNKERLLKGILDGETTTDIEPASREERLLKAILENGGGGGDALPTVTSSDANKGLVVNSSGEWSKSEKEVAQWYETPGADNTICTTYRGQIRSRDIINMTGIGDATLDLTDAESSVNQILTAMKALAAASTGTPVTRYVTMTGAEGVELRTLLISFLGIADGRRKYGKIKMGNNTYPVSSWYFDNSDVYYNAKVGYTAVEYDEADSKRYSTDITIAEASATSVRIYLTTTCTAFSSLM